MPSKKTTHDKAASSAPNSLPEKAAPARGTRKRKPSANLSQPGETPPFVVGIGASAGGLEALSNLIAALPTNLGLAYAVIQHLSSDHRSMMAALLGRETSMAVRDMHDGATPERDIIYVTPPGTNVILHQGCFVLQEEPVKAMPRPSINAFFSSLAAEKGENAIGVILSGTGTDGAAGLREIKAVGGFTFAQEPHSAKYNGMPQAAIDTGCVDWVLPAERIAMEIAHIARSNGVVTVDVNPPAAATTLKRLLMRVKQQTRVDFGGYKEGTVLRRVERRMAACHVATLDDYLALVENNLDELDRLSKDILISVTAFFRDPISFAVLRKTLQAVVANKLPGEEIRVWVPGCATGEEAYSIAVIFADLLGSNLGQYRIQIFATDIDLSALATARRGVYPETALADMDGDLAGRHFSRSGDRYEVNRALRDMVVIARQDLVQDPPFLRLDLVSCRNVLIYLQNDLQAKVLSTFHYGLRSGGYLFLGKSEGIFQQESLFEVADKAARLYRRRPGESRLLPSFAFRLPEVRDSAKTPQLDAQQRLVQTALDVFVPPSILINAAFEIQHMHGDVSSFLSVSAGKPTINLQQLIRREFRADLTLLLHQVEQKLQGASGRPHIINTLNGKLSARISVYPLERGVSSAFYLVAFEPVVETGRSTAGEANDEAEAAHDARVIEEELTATRERLQTVIEELETSNEEMQALNEEVQAANEELQSSNEELEAANEELQATNEELTTVNEEVQVRSGELAEALNDLEKIQNCVGFPILVCSANLELLRFNSPAAAMFMLSDKSIMQPLPHLRLPAGMQDFSARVREAIDSNITIEEMLFSNERQYLLHIASYETTKPGARGGIISLMDHTHRMSQEREVRESREQLLAIMNHSTSMISLKDLAGRYEFVNSKFEDVFQVKAADVIGKTDKQVFGNKMGDSFRAKDVEVLRRQHPLESEEALHLPSQERHLLTIRFPPKK